MSIEKKVICESCGNTIGYGGGVAIVGSVYTVDPNSDDGVGGGLVGGNSESVTHFHSKCIINLLYGKETVYRGSGLEKDLAPLTKTFI